MSEYKSEIEIICPALGDDNMCKLNPKCRCIYLYTSCEFYESYKQEVFITLPNGFKYVDLY